MNSKVFVIVLSAFVLSWGASLAQAGVIRSTSKAIGKGSAAVADTTADAAGAAVGGVQTAGKATGSALKTGTVAVGKGIVAAPSHVAHGTAAAAKKTWKAIW
jgi:hypothetical protein